MKPASHWAQMEEFSFIWGMRFLLPRLFAVRTQVLADFSYPVVSYYWMVNKQARQASREYLARLATYQPHCQLNGGLLWSYRHFISFANAIVDKLAAWSGSLSPTQVIYQGKSELMAAVAKGRGALILGSHLGNLEVCRIIGDFDKSVRANVLVHTKHAEKFNRLLNKDADASALKLIQVTEITAATAQMLHDKIEAGELVIMAADRTPVGGGRRVSRVDFLGAQAEFPQGPFILGALLKCPVYTLFCLKQDETYRLYFDHFSDCLEVPRQSREQSLQRYIQQYAERLQAYCLLAPLQWFNFYDFWQESRHADNP